MTPQELQTMKDYQAAQRLAMQFQEERIASLEKQVKTLTDCEAKYLQHADIGERLIPMPATALPPITTNTKKTARHISRAPFLPWELDMVDEQCKKSDAQYPTTQVANRGGPSAAVEPLPIKKRKVEWIDIPESRQSSPMANAEKDPGEIEDKLKEIEDMLLCPVCFEVYDAKDLCRAYV
ncbi:hypothetical protein L208DRAFT_1378110 [Tricholoma matsutake]|nr:hypothetical protein L208DRAFT_1378110 [Tricholoma matsutake 945]